MQIESKKFEECLTPRGTNLQGFELSKDLANKVKLNSQIVEEIDGRKNQIKNEL